MATRVIITTRFGPYLERKGVLWTKDKGQQYHSILLDGDDRPRAFRPDEYTRTK